MAWLKYGDIDILLKLFNFFEYVYAILSLYLKEPDRNIQLSRTQTSAVSEHANKTGHYPLWDEVKFIDRDPYWYCRRVKEAIHIRLHPNNLNRD